MTAWRRLRIVGAAIFIAIVPLVASNGSVGVSGATFEPSLGASTMAPDVRPTGGIPSLAAAPLTILTDGQFGGVDDAVAVQGQYAYVGVGPKLDVLDVSNPAQPKVVGSTGVLAWTVDDITVSGNYAYLALSAELYGSYGLGVLDVSNATTPKLVSFVALPTGAFPKRVALSGNLAFVGTANGGTFVFDVSQPTSPSLGTSIPLGSSLIDGLATYGDYLYQTNSNPTLNVTEALSNLSVGLTHSVSTGGPAWSVAVAGRDAFVAVGTGLQIFDLTNPTSPKSLALLSLPGNSVGVSAANGYAYVAASTGGLHVVNVANPAAPSLVGTYSATDSLSRVTAVGNVAYVAGTLGLRVIDVSNPSKPSQVGYFGTTPGNPHSVAVVGNTAYVADHDSGLHVVDITNVSRPVELASAYTTGANGIAVSGTHAYLTEGTLGMVIYDVSNPVNPKQVGSIAPPNGNAESVAVSGGYAYLADGPAGFLVVNVSNPASPSVVGSLTGGLQPTTVSVAGTMAYVGASDGFHVVDVSNQASPILAGYAPTPVYPTGSVVIGSNVFLSSTYGLAIVDVTNPVSPTVVQSAGNTYYGTGVAVQGNYAYVIDEFHGLEIFDVSNPANPSFLQTYVLPGDGQGITIGDGVIDVADGDGGLYFLANFGTNPKRVFLPIAISGATP